MDQGEKSGTVKEAILFAPLQPKAGTYVQFSFVPGW